MKKLMSFFVLSVLLLLSACSKPLPGEEYVGNWKVPIDTKNEFILKITRNGDTGFIVHIPEVTDKVKGKEVVLMKSISVPAKIADNGGLVVSGITENIPKRVYIFDKSTGRLTISGTDYVFEKVK